MFFVIRLLNFQEDTNIRYDRFIVHNYLSDLDRFTSIKRPQTCVNSESVQQ